MLLEFRRTNRCTIRRVARVAREDDGRVILHCTLLVGSVRLRRGGHKALDRQAILLADVLPLCAALHIEGAFAICIRVHGCPGVANNRDHHRVAELTEGVLRQPHVAVAQVAACYGLATLHALEEPIFATRGVEGFAAGSGAVQAVALDASVCHCLVVQDLRARDRAGREAGLQRGAARDQLATLINPELPSGEARHTEVRRPCDLAVRGGADIALVQHGLAIAYLLLPHDLRVLDIFTRLALHWHAVVLETTVRRLRSALHLERLLAAHSAVQGVAVVASVKRGLPVRELLRLQPRVRMLFDRQGRAHHRRARVVAVACFHVLVALGALALVLQQAINTRPAAGRASIVAPFSLALVDVLASLPNRLSRCNLIPGIAFAIVGDVAVHTLAVLATFGDQAPINVFAHIRLRHVARIHASLCELGRACRRAIQGKTWAACIVHLLLIDQPCEVAFALEKRMDGVAGLLSSVHIACHRHAPRVLRRGHHRGVVAGEGASQLEVVRLLRRQHGEHGQRNGARAGGRTETFFANIIHDVSILGLEEPLA
mmetsp:Transcript_18086/g.52214  ORF Transcript_18086/g.52214 Transcript_18086/m.52214 type:complete len:545 (+) Transcript_18086:3544-5178(+)